MHIYTHPEFLNHEVAEGHAERPERLSHLLAHLQREAFWRQPATSTQRR